MSGAFSEILVAEWFQPRAVRESSWAFISSVSFLNKNNAGTIPPRVTPTGMPLGEPCEEVRAGAHHTVIIRTEEQTALHIAWPPFGTVQPDPVGNVSLPAFSDHITHIREKFKFYTIVLYPSFTPYQIWKREVGGEECKEYVKDYFQDTSPNENKSVAVFTVNYMWRPH